MQLLPQPSPTTIHAAFVRIAQSQLKADRLMPGGDVETRLKHEFHLLRTAPVVFGLLAGWAGYVSATTAEPSVATQIITAASAATALFMRRHYEVARIAMPLVLREWQKQGPENLRKFIARDTNRP